MSMVRGIGMGSASALVAANMIGAGVFTTSGFALADLGSPIPVLIAWVVGGVLALCGALSYAGLAKQIPGNGGEYLFLSRTVHPLVGFLAGWVSLLAGFTAPIAVAAHSLEAYTRGSFGFELPSGVLGAGAIILAGLTHGIARAPGLRLQDIAVAAKLIAILAFIVIGAMVLGRGESIASIPMSTGDVSISAFAVTLVWISFAYSGWNAAVYVAGELDDPARTLPRALVLATLGVTLIYVALNAVFLFSAPISELAGKAEIGAVAAEALGGPVARAALSGVVALGLLTSISAMVMIGPRVYAQMAEDGVLPRSLAAGRDAPHRAVALQVSLSLVAFFMSELRDLLLYVGFLLGLSAAATVSCLFMKSMREQDGGPGVPGFPWVPGIFIVTTLGSAGFMVQRQPTQAAAGVVTLAIGAVVYYIGTRRRSASV
ncbi:MAG TPA: amino acid permease [Myxococcales bacterium]|nr:amino acid permease [Myxococcales bacterium]HIK85673.1 amino acid permease [Myxococcales bacterium]